MHRFILSILLAVTVSVYFAPTVIARRRMSRESIKIFVANLLLGWTLTGWIGALRWAMSADQPYRRPTLLVSSVARLGRTRVRPNSRH